MDHFSAKSVKFTFDQYISTADAETAIAITKMGTESDGVANR